jgi:hypothetical protein
VFNASMSGAHSRITASIGWRRQPRRKRVIWGVDFYAFDEVVGSGAKHAYGSRAASGSHGHADQGGAAQRAGAGWQPSPPEGRAWTQAGPSRPRAVAGEVRAQLVDPGDRGCSSRRRIAEGS